MKLRWMMGVLAAGVIAAMIGCEAAARDDFYEPLPDAGQKYELADVQRRVKQLEPGMSRLQVLATLGSPAVREYDYWDYMPDHSGLVIPARKLRVEFDRGRYIGHRMIPIVLGEDIGG